MMGWYGGGMGGGAWVLMGLFWVAVIAVIVWLVVRLLPDRAGAPPAPPVPPAAPAAPAQDSALEILDRRLARGEIDPDTYRAIRAVLAESGGGPR